MSGDGPFRPIVAVQQYVRSWRKRGHRKSVESDRSGLCIAQVTLHQKRSELGRALALSGRYRDGGWCKFCPKQSCFLTRRASHASTAPRQRALSDQSVLGE